MSSLLLTFSNIVINNFLSIREANINLSDEGFVTVKGINRSNKGSNGSGKSSIFDAIFWTLTGETLRGTSEVVNENHKDEGCLCSLTLYNKEDEYVITRTKSHKIHGNSCTVQVNGDIESDQVRKSQELINRLIPVVSSPEIFGSIVILGQGLPYKFSSFSPSKRKDLLETMSGSSGDLDSLKLKLDRIEATVSSDKRDACSNISRISGSLDSMSSSIDSLKSQLKNYENPENVDSLKARLKELSDTLEVLGNKQSEIASKISEEESRRSTLQNSLETYRSAYSLIKMRVDSTSTGNCPTCGRPFEVSESTLRELEVLKSKEVYISKLIEDTANQSKSIGDSINGLQSLRLNQATLSGDIRSQISDVSSKIALSENLSSQISATTERLNELESKSRGLLVEKDDISKKIAVYDEKLECISYMKRLISREFKGYILDEVIHFLSDRSKYYGSKLFSNSDEVSVTLSGSKINISVGNRLYENLSGGERQRVDLAIQFSLRDMLMTVTGFSCNMLVMDEVFDNLDLNGSELLVQLITSDFSDVDTVYIITHRSEILVPYDSEITVIKEVNGDSTVS